MDSILFRVTWNALYKNYKRTCKQHKKKFRCTSSIYIQQLFEKIWWFLYSTTIYVYKMVTKAHAYTHHKKISYWKFSKYYMIHEPVHYMIIACYDQSKATITSGSISDSTQRCLRPSIWPICTQVSGPPFIYRLFDLYLPHKDKRTSIPVLVWIDTYQLNQVLKQSLKK